MTTTPFVSVNNPIFDVSQRYIATSSDVNSLSVATKPPSSGRGGSLTAVASADSLNAIANTPYVFSIPIGSNNRPLLSASCIRITGHMATAAAGALVDPQIYSHFLPWNLGFACLQSYSLKFNNSNASIIDISDRATEYLTAWYLSTHSLEAAENDPAICPPIAHPWDTYSTTTAGAATVNTGRVGGVATGAIMACRARTERVLDRSADSHLKPITIDVPISYLAGLPDAVLNNVSFIEIKVGLRACTDILEFIGAAGGANTARFNICKMEVVLVSPIVGVKQTLETIASKSTNDDNLAISFPREHKNFGFSSGSDILIPTMKHMQRMMFYQIARNVVNTAGIYSSWGQFLPWITTNTAVIAQARDATLSPTSMQMFVGTDLSFPQNPVRTFSTTFDPSELFYYFLLATNQFGTTRHSPMITLANMRATMPFCMLSPYLTSAGAHIDVLARDLIIRCQGGPANTTSFQVLVELLRCFKLTSAGDLIQIL